MWLLLLVTAALTPWSSALNDCSRGACYPPSGDLLLGRAQHLKASSTCGLHGSEVFCTPFQQWKMKCCPCDSRTPAGRLAHTVGDVLSSSGPERWWQSKKDVSPVTLELDLNNLFQLGDLILKFKGPRPNALIVERTLDNGRTWQPALYMADDCRKSFPTVATTTPRTLDETYCYTMPAIGPNHYKDQTIQFSPLRQYAYVPAPTTQKIEEVSALMGLRVRLLELGEVPRLPGRALSRFYALREMKVMGSCMCHGHANRCLPHGGAQGGAQGGTSPNGIQVGAQCDCQHNTAGVNCERCADLYNDLPWRPAEEGNTHTCQRCQCNNHAERCHFDPAVYEASGRRSGGVCDGCMHHTAGHQCQECAPGYQPNPRSRMDRADACIRCSCHADGALNGGHCDDITGLCQCKANVEGPNCDRCKMGYYGLSASSPLGCSKCSCSAEGSRSSVCDPVTGQCPCHAHHYGLTCEQCAPGYWKPFWKDECEACRCDPWNSASSTCDQWTGQCTCKPGFGGPTCNECPDNMFGDPLTGCQRCQCSTEGTTPEVCDKRTGACLCRQGVVGPRCDACGRGYCHSFPGCEVCPSCFFTLDAQRRNISLALERLIPISPWPPTDTGVPGELGPRINALMIKLSLMRDSIVLPPSSTVKINGALSKLNSLRDRLDQVDGLLTPLERVSGLRAELDELQAMLDRLGLDYNVKKEGLKNTVNNNNAGTFSAIKNAYDESKEAAKKVDASGKTVDQSESIRKDIMDQDQVQTDNTKDLDKLSQDMASKPNLTPVAKQVCGSTRTSPCTPAQCEGGSLCPPEGAPPCGRKDTCVGALPLGKRAVNDTEEVKDQLEKLGDRISDTAEQLEETENTANQMRASTEKLSNQIKKAKEDLEDDLKETRDVVKELKDFLSDPTSDPELITEVSEWVLNAKLPLSLAALKRKLEELKKLAAGLPDSSAVLREAQPQLEKARKLLKEAQNARDVALDTKDGVETLLEGFDTVEGSLEDMDEKVQESMDILDDLKKNLDQVKGQLDPAEKALGEVKAAGDSMKPQLVELRDLLLSGGQEADEATGEAQRAKEEAEAAAKELEELEKKLKLLQDAERNSGRGDGAEPASKRLQKMQEEAGLLAKEGGDMMRSLAGKAESLRDLQEEILRKSEQLNQMDTKLLEILKDLREKANVLSTCQG